MLPGSINHVSITVTDLAQAMGFFGPLLEFLGYTVGEIIEDGSGGEGTSLTVNINEPNGTAVNIWRAKPGFADHPFEIYEPGLHQLCFNVLGGHP